MNINLKNCNRIIIIIFGIFLSGCALKNNRVNVADDNNDPYESTNRAVFAFNEDLDELIFKPVARGWRKIPDFPRKNLSNLAETATAPLDIANSILQFDIESIRLTLSRFLINITFGIGGMYDVASTKEFGNIEKRNEDFGQTLATWGVKEGPYVMLPIFGPSNIRDAIGRGMDTIFNPVTFVFRMNNLGFESRLPQPVVSGVSTREKYMDYVDEIKESSLDFYATMRSLYRQKRIKDINNGKKKIQKINYQIPGYDDPEIEEENLDIFDKNFIDNSQTIKSDMNSLPSSDYPEYNEDNNELLTN
tara:strand:+ start:198 stop:1112 length:915 start_codon:yes stop_codon:yes gene_type:complete